MKNCKIFCKVQTASHLKELSSLLPSHRSPDKTLLRLWNKNFLKEIFRNTQAFAFKVLQECSSWASRNGACNIFSDTKQKHDCCKICEVRNIFGCVAGALSSELRFVKWVTLFERNCIVKCVIFFANFCWLWDFPLENLKIKRNSDEDHRNAWKNMKMLYSQNIFKNRIPNMRFWIIYILVQISFFGGLL